MKQFPNCTFYTIENISSIFPLLRDLPKDALVLFDFNNTVLMHQDFLIRLKEYSSPLSAEIKFLEKAALENQISLENLYSQAYLLKEPFMPVEKEIYEVLQYLDKAQINTGILTSCKIGSFGYIRDLPNVLLEKLKENNMDFSRFLGGEKETIITLLPSHQILFKEGVIFGTQRDKGELLKSFLNYFKIIPSTIVVIDDLLENIENIFIQQEFLASSIVGIHYVQVQTHSQSIPNKRTYKKQIDKIIREKTWISEREIL